MWNDWKSVQFSSSVVSDSLPPHEPLHVRPPCPLPTPGVHSNSCPLCQWWHPTISSSVIPFSCFQSFPASGSFQWASCSYQVAKVLSFRFNTSPSNEHQGLISFMIKWSKGWSPCCPRDPQESSPTPQFKSINSSAFSFLYSPSLTSIHTEKTMALTRWTFVDKVMSLLFNILSRWVIAFLPRSKCLLISWLQSPSAVILEPPKIKSLTVSSSICYEVMGPDARS